MLASKVFNSQYLIENILNYLSDDIMRHLDIRRVNKSFNNVILAILRKSYRKMKIEHIPDEMTKDYLYINHKRVKLTEVDQYFRFLNKVANVKVEKIVIELWELALFHCGKLHSSIISNFLGENRGNLKSVVGIDDVCFFFDCKHCLELVQICEEYGPLNYIILENYNKPCHFKKLVITDHALDRIASECSSNSKEECLEALNNKFIHSNFSCDKLVFELYERRENAREPQKGIDHHPVPREVVDLMILKWNVKSIGLIFIRTLKIHCYQEWAKTGWFTEFRFNDPFDSVEQKNNSNLKLSHVHVDLSKSYYCSNEIRNNVLEDVELKGYINIIAVIRRVFPTDYITIDCSHWLSHSHGTILTVFKSMLKVITKDDHRNLKIDFQYFPKLETFKSGEKLEEIQEIPFHHRFDISIQDPLIHCYRRSIRTDDENSPKKFVKETWIGKRIQFKDHQKNCQINFDVFVNENDKCEFSEELIKNHPNALVRHFIPPFHL